MKNRLLLLAAVILIGSAAHAQDGCVNSPENPTAILALVGLVSAGVTSRLRLPRKRK